MLQEHIKQAWEENKILFELVYRSEKENYLTEAAGMHLHLSKPMDPPKLYRSWYEFNCQE